MTEAKQGSAQERLLLIRSLPTLDGLDDDGAAYLAECARTVTAPAGSVLHEEGQPLDRVWVVLEGALRSVRDGVEVAVVRPPFGLGFLSVAAQDAEGVRAEVLEPSRLLELPADAIEELRDSNFSYGRNALRNLARNLLDLRGSLPSREGFVRGRDRFEWPTPLSLVDRLRFYRRKGLLASVSMEAVVDLARAVEEVPLVEGQVLWERGAPPDYAVRIVHGRVRCATDESEVEVGDDFALGVLELLSDEPRRYRATVSESGRGLRFSAHSFLGVLEVHRGVLQELMALFARSTLKRGWAP